MSELKLYHFSVTRNASVIADSSSTKGPLLHKENLVYGLAHCQVSSKLLKIARSQIGRFEI